MKHSVKSMFVVLALIAFVVPAMGATYYVDAGIGSPGAGGSWASALQQIQQGIDAASSGDDVFVKGGTYVENITMKDGVAVYGSFAGTETDPASRDVETTSPMNWANLSIIDGGGVSNTVVFNTITNARLDGFQVTNGYEAGGAGYGPPDSGGGIQIIYGDDTNVVANCWIHENVSAVYGAGFGIAGAGAYSPMAMVTRCWVTSNTGPFGAGSRLYYCSSLIDRVHFYFNIGTYDGAAIRNDGRVQNTVQNCLFDRNAATVRWGGAVYWYHSASSAELYQNCTFVNNASDDGGDAIFLRAGPAPGVQNCIFAHNLTRVVNSVTVGDNSAVGGYSSAYFNFFRNNHFYNNTADWATVGGAGTISGATAINAVASWSYDNQDGDPLFQDYAGGDFHILFPSPCKDAGIVIGAPLWDLDGLGRGDGQPDIGCYEWGASIYSAEDWVLY